MTGLLYPQEHVTCYNYEKNNRPTIEQIVLEKDQRWKLFSIEGIAIFIIKGSLSFSYGKYENEEIAEGKIMLLPAHNDFNGHTATGCEVLLIRLLNTRQLCDCLSLEELLQEKGESFKVKTLMFLDINPRMEAFLDLLLKYLRDGLKCIFFFELKTKEFYFILRAYYTKEELLEFFYPLLNNNLSFSDFVLKNHNKARTVQELAKLSHYSLSGFQKRFKKVFGMSAYHWMKEERSKSIYHQINSTDKSFKEICDEYGFSSPSHFNDFCKTHFGATPGRIRRKSSFNRKN
ncbi:MAG: AraC family transcriptional regulator [Dysgonomonas sp.]|nr:AraC family transcriptional regulator [Dysgonomonas sp.]